jgi:hypothetical protein
MAGDIFDPLDKRNFAESIARALLDQPLLVLPLQERFSGPGIYALYYVGPLAVYASLARRQEHDWPIYVGKAESKELSRTPLYSRIKQHVNSIIVAENLSPEDFRCRYLLVDDAWVSFAEIRMIEKYRPLWNSTCLPGIGGHAPGRGRGGQQQSLWDTLHPGRTHAANRPVNPTAVEEIEANVQQYLNDTINHPCD